MNEKTPPAPATESSSDALDGPLARVPQTPVDDYLYDVLLAQVDEARRCLVFVHEERTHRVNTPHLSFFTAGSIGRLRLPSPQAEFAFHLYADQRLRRAGELDEAATQRWGWRIQERRFHVRAGLLPGRNGLVVPEDTRALSLAVPREFLDYCQSRGLTPITVLRAFIADLCEIQNLFARPREDGYSSHGSDERRLAQEYFQRTFGWTDEPAYRAQISPRRRGRKKTT